MAGVRAGWQCRDCRNCQICRQPGDESKLMSCELCDKVYHPQCLRPIVTSIPKYGWKCKVSLFSPYKFFRTTINNFFYCSVVEYVQTVGLEHQELDYRLVGTHITRFAIHVINKETKDFLVRCVIEPIGLQLIEKWFSAVHVTSIYHFYINFYFI